MKKVSSIEYLVNIVQSCIAPNYIPELIIKQAKEMHKQEIFEAWANAAIDATYGNRFSSPEQYYNETFNNLTPNNNNNEKII